MTVVSSSLPQVFLIYLDTKMIQPGKSYSQNWKMISQFESFLWTRKTKEHLRKAEGYSVWNVVFQLKTIKMRTTVQKNHHQNNTHQASSQKFKHILFIIFITIRLFLNSEKIFFSRQCPYTKKIIMIYCNWCMWSGQLFSEACHLIRCGTILIKTHECHCIWVHIKTNLLAACFRLCCRDSRSVSSVIVGVIQCVYIYIYI